jgi:hypothetical protein
VEASTVARDPLARWTIVTIRWPELAERLRRDPEGLDAGKRDDLSEELRDLLQDPMVQKVTSTLTPEAIRASTGPGEPKWPTKSYGGVRASRKLRRGLSAEDAQYILRALMSFESFESLYTGRGLLPR